MKVLPRSKLERLFGFPKTYQFTDISDYLEAVSENKINDKKFYVVIEKTKIKKLEFTRLDRGLLGSADRVDFIIGDDNGKSLLAYGYSATAHDMGTNPIDPWSHIKLANMGDEVRIGAMKRRDEKELIVDRIENYSLEKRLA